MHSGETPCNRTLVYKFHYLAGSHSRTAYALRLQLQEAHSLSMCVAPVQHSSANTCTNLHPHTRQPSPGPMSVIPLRLAQHQMHAHAPHACVPSQAALCCTVSWCTLQISNILRLVMLLLMIHKHTNMCPVALSPRAHPCAAAPQQEPDR